MRVRSEELWRAVSNLPNPATYEYQQIVILVQEHRPPPYFALRHAEAQMVITVQQLVFRRTQYGYGDTRWWEWTLEVAP